jgi:prophage antirepressor-like protein
MEQDQPINQIQLFDFAYDAQRRLTKVIYRGREAVVAMELGQLLRYAKNGGKLVEMITTRWTEDFREGVDYDVLKGLDLQDFKDASPVGGVASKTSQLMILYTSGIDLVLLKTEKRIGNHLRHWLTDEVFPSLRKTGTYTLNPSDRKALPVPALFTEEIRTALSKIKSSFVVAQKDRPTPRDFAIEWDETHKAHTASMFHGMGKSSNEIKAIARQRGVKVLSNTSARKLMYDMVDFRHTNISESAEIDLERIGLPRERARRIAITQGQPYFKALVDEGIDQDSLEQSL